MNDIAQIIATLGFPIAMCGALCWYIYKVQSPMTTAIVKLTERVDRLIDELERKGTETGTAGETGRKAG